MEQIPANKSKEQVEEESNSFCCRCRKNWSSYRGKFKCREVQCGVPVIVCDTCKPVVLLKPQTLVCELCREGYVVPAQRLDLVDMKRTADSTVLDGESPRKKQKPKSSETLETVPNRLFISRLPLTVSRTKLENWLGCSIETLQWCVDKDSGAFYGSCVVQVPDAKTVMAQSREKMDQRKPRVSLALTRRADRWPPPGNDAGEYPPLGR